VRFLGGHGHSAGSSGPDVGGGVVNTTPSVPSTANVVSANAELVLAAAGWSTTLSGFVDGDQTSSQLPASAQIHQASNRRSDGHSLDTIETAGPALTRFHSHDDRTNGE
jgi:hypothetical protein